MLSYITIEFNLIKHYRGCEKMKINKVSIKGIGGIDELDLEFKDGINMISGANGIGKTTILNIIKDAFTYNNRKVKRNVAYEKGEYSIEFNHAGEQHNLKHEIKAFEPEQGDGMNTQYQMAKYIMSFEENRDIKYIKLGNIPFDPKRSPVDTSKIAVDGISADDLKGWFANRFLFSKQEKSLTDEYSNAIVHAFQKFRAPFSGKIVHIFPEQSAVI